MNIRLPKLSGLEKLSKGDLFLLEINCINSYGILGLFFTVGLLFYGFSFVYKVCKHQNIRTNAFILMLFVKGVLLVTEYRELLLDMIIGEIKFDVLYGTIYMWYLLTVSLVIFVFYNMLK